MAKVVQLEDAMDVVVFPRVAMLPRMEEAVAKVVVTVVFDCRLAVMMVVRAALARVPKCQEGSPLGVPFRLDIQAHSLVLDRK